MEDQRAFLGSVRDPTLQSVFMKVAMFTNEIVRMGLGREFLRNENRYIINTDIMSQFLASFLDLRGDNVDMLMLLRKVFKEDFIGDDVTFFIFAEVGMGIPWVNELTKILLPSTLR